MKKLDAGLAVLLLVVFPGLLVVGGIVEEAHPRVLSWQWSVMSAWLVFIAVMIIRELWR